MILLSNQTCQTMSIGRGFFLHKFLIAIKKFSCEYSLNLWKNSLKNMSDLERICKTFKF